MTYNQVIKNLNNIADSHLQINSFFYGYVEDIATSGTIYYPMMSVTPTPAYFRDKALYLNFTIAFMDLVHKGGTNVQDVESDMLSVALDIISQLQSSEYGFMLDTNSPRLEPFRDKFADEVTGWSCDLILKLPIGFDRCQIPIETINII